MALSFTSTDDAFDSNVQNVSFRLNDVDFGADPNNEGGVHLDGVTINGYDAEGNLVPVTITPGSDVGLSGNTLSGMASTYEATDEESSALVEIEGPVIRIEISYTNGGEAAQRVYFSDVHF